MTGAPPRKPAFPITRPASMGRKCAIRSSTARAGPGPSRPRCSTNFTSATNWTPGKGPRRSTVSPFYQFNDSISWVKGKHSFQFGFEIDRTSSASANSGGTQTTRPSVTLGIGNVAPPFTTSTFPGIGSLNLTTAQNLAANLAGSVSSITEQYWVNSPTATTWNSYLN